MALPLPLLVAWVLLATDPRLAQADALIARGDCDGLIELYAEVKPGGGEDELAHARALAQGAHTCRKQDAVLALALSELARKLAPEDYGVATIHAETLLALDQRSAAARTLDETLRRHPDGAIRARYLRAELAHAEHEPERVVQLLAPIAGDPEYGERARALLERSRRALEEQEASRSEVKEAETRVAQRAEAAEAMTKRALLPSGTEVWSSRSGVKSGGARTYKTRGIQGGLSYELVAVGTCAAPAKGKRKRIAEDPSRLLFGIDFAVRVSGGDPRPLKVGFTPETNRVLFRAPHENPQLLIEDRSFEREGSGKKLRCAIGELSVRVP